MLSSLSDKENAQEKVVVLSSATATTRVVDGTSTLLPQVKQSNQKPVEMASVHTKKENRPN